MTRHHKPRKCTPIDAQIGRRIVQCRKSKKITGPMLAHSVGITYQQLQKYEAGTNRVSASRLLDIAKALEVPVSGFLSDTGFDEVRSAGIILSPDERRLIEMFASIESRYLKKKLLQLAEAMVEK